MSAGVRWRGLDNLIQTLTDAPSEIRAEGGGIVREETEGAAAEVLQSYPRASGTLAARVKTEYPSSDILVGILKSTAPHSHIYEFGTQQRRNSGGANRGVMPAANVLVPIAQRRRERMYRRLAEMLERRGFTIATSPG